MNPIQLKKRCLARFEDFESEGVLTTIPGLKPRVIYANREPEKVPNRYIFQDNRAQVLGIAHLDTVNTYNHFHVNEIAGEHYIFNAQLDDRLGAYILLDWLPKLGVKIDVLLTEGEESGQSTAEYFVAPRPYNWIFSFDRHGTDVVLYQYDNEDNRAILKEAGFKVGIGSFSDIASLDTLGVSGFNFGTGYYNNHDLLAYAIAEDTNQMVKRFVTFYEQYKDERIPYVYKPRYTVIPAQTGTASYWNNYPEWSKHNSRYDYCDACHRETTASSMIVWGEYLLCSRCYTTFMEEEAAEINGTCSSCQLTFNPTDLMIINGKAFCPECLRHRYGSES